MNHIGEGCLLRRAVPAFFFLTAVVTAVAVTGCGRGVPPVEGPPLHHTFDSPESLSRAVLDALADSDDKALADLPLSEQEFRTVVWPELPSSRPERGVPFEYAWGDLHQKSTHALRRLLAGTTGRRLELVSVAFDGESTTYDSFTVYRETVLTLRDEEGVEMTESLFGSILQRDEEYALFSYVVD